ncbi:alpha/beta fold hydrolase [Cyanobium sp. Morenito 9A2]|uniref:alpha/beta fold hydrolase n=1 Tax=Cyanobium sp. Morenito 9A2 TaxID=2823718 RepID=UPI0020CEF48C|nr:alpha/beta fold hydrolase [Cyanobium sp. Morenito 9A2]MCP9849461.1 alpha/beta fold hydrolase [Cyanobium sp. Morenito 9A2]
MAHWRGQGPTLMFIHGALGHRFNWRCQFEAALERGWGPLAYDLGGHGQSSPYPAYSIGRHGSDLRRRLEHQGPPGADPLLPQRWRADRIGAGASPAPGRPGAGRRGHP